MLKKVHNYFSVTRLIFLQAAEFSGDNTILTFKVIVLVQKLTETSDFFFIEKYEKRTPTFVIDIFDFLMYFVTKSGPKF